MFTKLIKYFFKMEDIFDTIATISFAIFVAADPAGHVELPPSVLVLVKIAYGGIICSSFLAIAYWVPKIRKTIRDDYNDSIFKYFRKTFEKRKKDE